MGRVIVGIVGVATGLFFLCCNANAQTADWEVLDRFRVLDKLSAQRDAPAIDQDNYVDRIISIRGAKKYISLIDPDYQIRGDNLNWTTAWDVIERQYGQAWFHSRVRKVRVSLHGVPRKAECVWKRTGISQSGSSCEARTFTNVPLDQVTQIEITVRSAGRRPEKVLTADVNPHNVVIAMIGDSYGSGEGNPHLVTVPNRHQVEQQTKYPAIWWDTRCHRSLLSSAAQASGFLAFQNKKQSVTFVSYACSGAEIEEGILQPFAGRQTVPQTQKMWEDMDQPAADLPDMLTPKLTARDNTDKLRPQIDVLSELLCGTGDNCARKVQPDILLIAVGGNDIAFGEIVRDLLLTNPPSGKKERDAWRKNKEDELSPVFNRLSDRFEKLASAVREKIRPKSVYLYEYVDPTQYGLRNGKTLTCGTKGDAANSGRFGKFKAQFEAKSYKGAFAPGSEQQRLDAYAKNFSLYNLLLTQDEGEFAHWVVQNLDDRIRDAGNKLTWTDTGAHAAVLQLQNLRGPDDLPRGVCAENSWFIGIFESWQKQDWIPEDKINSYPLILATQSTCKGVGDWRDGKCWVPAGPVTSGILHPNFFGHYNVAQVLLKRLKENLTAQASSPATAQNTR